MDFSPWLSNRSEFLPSGVPLHCVNCLSQDFAITRNSYFTVIVIPGFFLFSKACTGKSELQTLHLAPFGPSAIAWDSLGRPRCVAGSRPRHRQSPRARVPPALPLGLTYAWLGFRRGLFQVQSSDLMNRVAKVGRYDAKFSFFTFFSKNTHQSKSE